VILENIIQPLILCQVWVFSSSYVQVTVAAWLTWEVPCSSHTSCSFSLQAPLSLPVEERAPLATGGQGTQEVMLLGEAL
jgi:hypothetical protein